MNLIQFKQKFENVPIEHYSNYVPGDPVVSVCVQTYQHVQFIRECLDSILMQKTNFHYEVLLGDDFSTDGTREICIEYANKYPEKIRLFLHRRENNIILDGKPSGRFNFIYNLLLSQGKYIAICEGDDYWTDKEKLQKQVNFLESNLDYNICFHPAFQLKNGNVISVSNEKLKSSNGSFSITDLAERNFIHTPTVMYRNSIVKTLPDWLAEAPVGDYILHTLAAKSGKIKFISEPMAVYRIHDGGIWMSSSARQQKIKWIKVLDFLINDDFSEDVKKIFNLQKHTFINSLIENSIRSNSAQVASDIEDYVLPDKELTKYWLTYRFPKMLRNMNNDRSLKWGNRVLKIFKFFGR